MKYALGDLIDLPQLQRLMETLYQATGINHALIDNDSVVHTAVGWQDICTKFHRVNPVSCARCLDSDRYIFAHLNEGPYVGYRCPQGLVDYATPVIIEGEHIANIFTGQMLHEPPDIEFFRKQAHELGFDEAAYLDALKKVHVIPREHIENIMAFQVQLAQMLAKSGLTRLRQLDAEAGLLKLNQELAQRVEERTQELHERNRQLSHEVAERMRAEQEVREINEALENRVVQRTAQLEAANKELEEFSYSMSHDMRAPLRAIDGFSKILLDEHGVRLDDEGRRLLKVVRDNAQRMGRLIDDILRFLRMGKRRMEYGAIDIALLAREAFAELQAGAPQRRLRLEIGPLPLAWGDREMIRQALLNLLSNAVKFSPAEAVVELAGAAEGDEDVYRVKDRGIGFDMQYVDKLFRVFERVHPTGQYEGTGIGLAIVKRIVDRHGGRVWAEGRVGEGATFHFSLPHRRA